MKEIDEIVNNVLSDPETKYPQFTEKPQFLGIEKFKDGKMF